MKKLIILILALTCTKGFSQLAPDSDFLTMLPNTKGARLTSKSYDANNNFTGTLMLTVVDSREFPGGSTLEMNYDLSDNAGQVVTNGRIEATYNDSQLTVKMGVENLTPNVGQFISMIAQLSGSFLDYPNIFNNNLTMWDDFTMDGGDFAISSPNSPESAIRIQMFNRDYIETGEITVPAGTFTASKIEFTADVTFNESSNTYRGVEWFVPGAGIVRMEIYDGDSLVEYSVLTSITE